VGEPDGLAKASVADVRVAVPAGAGVEAGLVVLQEDDPPQRTVRIVIGQPEARAITAAWSGAVPARPSTWDLFVSALAVVDARVERAVVTAVEGERHFFATIEVERAGERRVLASRPSDAIALALRSPGAAIYVHRDVLASVGVAG
jgi:bifunctional DNase/RNase